MKPARDAHACGAFGASESTRDLRERKLLGDSELDGSGHRRGKLLDRRGQPWADGPQVRELLDAGKRRVVEGDALDLQPSARAVVDPLSPQCVVKLVARY